MSLEHNIFKYGAKGAILDYIRNNIPTIPIEQFVLIPVGENWKNLKSEIEYLGRYILIRSSSPLEDRMKTSFAGLFETIKIDSQTENIENAVKASYLMVTAELF